MLPSRSVWPNDLAKRLVLLATVGLGLVAAVSAFQAQLPMQLPMGHSHQHNHNSPLPQHHLPVSSSLSNPPPTTANVFASSKQTFRLSNVLAHGAPGTKHERVFRSLDVTDDLRLRMAASSPLDINAFGDDKLIRHHTTLEHTVKDALFDEAGDDGDGEIDAKTSLPRFPWARVPDPTDMATVQSMIRMALDCYLEPQAVNWVDIGDGWHADEDIGWLQAGLRGYVFLSADNKTAVVGFKGTSLKLFGTGGGPTGDNDKLNDNKMFSCCCGKVDRTWWGVCGCYMGGNQCNQQCLRDDLIKDRDEQTSYYGLGIKVLRATRVLYPDATIWLTGHSLGGSVASLVGFTHDLPTFTFQSPGDMLFAKRIGLVPQDVTESQLKRMPIWQFGHNADPIFMGTCNGAASTCYSAGYAMEAKCHLGKTCVYDTAGEMGWRQDIRVHPIVSFIPVVDSWNNITLGRETVPVCSVEQGCEDCIQWEYVQDPTKK